MIEEVDVGCPYCGETITVVIDTTAGPQRYVEDCFVCCQPIVLSIAIDIEGQVETVAADVENA